ncbi:hypothetical protein ES332_A09G286900v1 [Gossypium tomentosum]|uniref:SAP domain-containing protein n=1 Tax=Gossypium tomentosum TaxID=34277 RepID=A0A5D2P8T5_GOSTO|nr:hypothetical protein ES332_A09G286900v1 [Gossypium tomentosum]
MLNNNKVGSSSKDVKAAVEGPRKRAAEKVMDSSASAKKANTKNNSQSEGSSSIVAKKDYHSFTVERLRALLKERGLSPKGKKDIIYPNNEEDDAVAEGSWKNDEVKEGLKFASDDIEGEEKKTQEDNKGTARDDGIMKIDGKSCKSMVHGGISKMQAAKK